MNKNDLKLVQPHTLKIYNLENKNFQRKNIPARNLLVSSRFDLFAKLAYIHFREKNPDLALNIYNKHIKVFNPDLKEPGRTDKNNLHDFISTFDDLIQSFSLDEFDSSQSLVPVSENGVPLDGSHRIAALAYFNKNIEILQFEDVFPVADFDYNYFLKRGIRRATADQITAIASQFTPQLFVACLWPRMGTSKNKNIASSVFRQEFDILYEKEIRMSLNNLTKFIYEIYKHQDWVGNEKNNFQGAKSKATQCYGNSKTVRFVFFKSKSLQNVLDVKDKIRAIYKLDKHALHITDNHQETEDIVQLILTNKVKEFENPFSIRDIFNEQLFLFKNKHLINIKVKMASILKKTGLLKVLK